MQGPGYGLFPAAGAFQPLAVFPGTVIILAGKPMPQAIEHKIGPATVPIEEIVQA